MVDTLILQQQMNTMIQPFITRTGNISGFIFGKDNHKFEGFIEQDFSDITPNQYLSNSCPLSAIEHTVEAIVASDSVRAALRLGINEPCLLLNRRTWSGDKLISTALLYHPGTRYKLSSKVMF